MWKFFYGKEADKCTTSMIALPVGLLIALVGVSVFVFIKKKKRRIYKNIVSVLKVMILSVFEVCVLFAGVTTVTASQTKL